MTGSVTVQQGGASSGGGEEEPNPEEMGVPFQAHFVGIATILMMVVSVIYTFFTLKYGESPHAKGGNN
ncbi:halocyanin hcpE [Halococcus salifodinae DSM 8989]|uniref:Halocyanin hcpE n=2 Tax=Halococcus salifodinae TaxID=36738 RepID=M0MTJ1_9EURY|nr:halocyanin hcpE [Halococcus salifodinae DSM 8989]